MSLTLFISTITKGYPNLFMFLIPLLSILFGILVLISKNPIVSVLYLIGLFISISLYLMNIGLYFMGLSYILVYVGAISILFVFILMLINIRVSELVTENRNSMVLAIMGIIFITLSLENILPYPSFILDILQDIPNYFRSSIFSTETDLNTVLSEYVGNTSSKVWDGNLLENSHITSIGNILYTDLLMQIIITGFVILLAMVGAIMITVEKL